MTTDATLTIEPAPEAAPDATRYAIDCRHGTTVAVHLPGGDDPLTPAQYVIVLAVKHELEERCGCVDRLYRRYAAPLYRQMGEPLPTLASIGRTFDQATAGVA